MKKKRLIGASMLAASIAVTASFTGCSLVSANSNADMAQVIATVNISAADGMTENDSRLVSEYKSAVGTGSVIKRELLAYFLNAGYSQVQNGASYADVFESLLDSLIQNQVLTQYAVMYVLDYKAEKEDLTPQTILNEYNSKETYSLKLEYLLNDRFAYPDDPDKDVKIAKYNLYSSINSAIDSYEETYLDDEDSSSGSGSRATPGGVDATREDYYPAKENKELDYNVYTGYPGYRLADSGKYQEDAHDGTTKATRIKAYNDFLSSLVRNGLVDPKEENLTDIINGVDYIGKEYEGQLEARLLEKYYDLYEEEQEAKLAGGDYGYIEKVYNDLLRSDKSKNGKVSGFSSTMDNFSDSSFILYSPDTEGEGTFGYVYNILMPFSTVQSARLTQLQSAEGNKDEDGNYNINYYTARNKLLREIKTYDRRDPWFNGSTDYSFKATDDNYFDYHKDEPNPYQGASRGYLFFENNLTDPSHYEPLEKYDGRYAYNGYVYEKAEGGYVLVPNQLTIDDMLKEFTAYVNFVLGDDGEASYTDNDATFDDLTDLYSNEEKKEINYENFIYATGKVEFNGNPDEKSYRGNLFNKDSAQYKALSAANELQYAYTTDTSVLSRYVGYSVALGDSTGYIKEFEAAAHKAIESGAGSFVVCGGDYGWHLIYVTYTFGKPDGKNNIGGDEYSPDWQNNVGVEGTFENLFYEWIKSTEIDQISTTRRTQLIYQFDSDATVTKYRERYKDLLELDA